MATLVARNANEAMVTPVVGSGGVCVWRESGVRRSVLCGAFGWNLASVAVKMFSRLIYFMKKFYKCCTLNAICKDNAAVNCITVPHKTGLFPSTLTGHTLDY
jgi:hypothetical protein